MLRSTAFEASDHLVEDGEEGAVVGLPAPPLGVAMRCR
jgi:hypothetical protein